MSDEAARAMYGKVLDHAGAPPDLQEIEDRLLDKLADRLGYEEALIVKGINGAEDEETPDFDAAIEQAPMSVDDALAKGIVVNEWIETPQGPVHMDDVTAALMAQVTEAINDKINKALEPVAEFMGAISAKLGILADLETLNTIRINKALAGVSASAVASYGRQGTVPNRTEPITTTGTPLSKGGNAVADNGLSGKLFNIDPADRRRRLNKAIEAGSVDEGRADIIDQLLYAASQIPDAPARDQYLKTRLSEAETAAMLGQGV